MNILPINFRNNFKLNANNRITGGEKHMANSNSNQLVVPGVQQALDQMKYEIASEFGVTLGPDSTSRSNGSVGGEITKRLVTTAQQQLNGNQPK